jgi:geranylgeranyl diphosphate synthase type I
LPASPKLKDDELGLFGTEKEIGKPVGSDIEEGKKTVFIALLHERAADRQRDRINKILRKKHLNSPELDYIRRLVEELGIREEAHRKASELAKKAEEQMQRLKNIREESRKILLELVKYNLERTS